MIKLSTELEGVIERHVLDGRATSASAFVEEAVRRLVDEGGDEEEDVRRAVEAGGADIDAGRYVTVASDADERRVLDGLMARLRSRFLPPSGWFTGLRDSTQMPRSSENLRMVTCFHSQ